MNALYHYTKFGNLVISDVFNRCCRYDSVKYPPAICLQHADSYERFCHTVGIITIKSKSNVWSCNDVNDDDDGDYDVENDENDDNDDDNDKKIWL